MSYPNLEPDRDPNPNPKQLRPLLYLHRLQTLDFPFQSKVSKQFTLIDPWTTSSSPDHHTSLLPSIRALICFGPTPLTSDTLALLPSLELVVCCGVGLDRIDLRECRVRGIRVTNAGKAFAEDCADYAVALLIDVLRKLSAGNRYVKNGLWVRNGAYPLGFKLGGKRVGIVGLGNIGTEVAKRLKPFGCYISYNSRNKKSSVPFPFYHNVRDLAANSDILILCCSLTDETHHMINKEVMTALGNDGVIINLGRGALIDEKELVRCLVHGQLRGAGLDVFENEPDVPKELFQLDNVVLSPHCAVLTPGSLESLQDLLIANLKAFFSNAPLLSLVA